MHLSVAAKQSLAVTGLILVIAFLLIGVLSALVTRSIDENHVRVAESIARIIGLSLVRNGPEHLEDEVSILAESHPDIIALDVLDNADPPRPVLSLRPEGRQTSSAVPPSPGAPQRAGLQTRTDQGRPVHFIQLPFEANGQVAGNIAVTFSVVRLEALRQQALVMISAIAVLLVGALIGVYWAITQRLLGSRLAGLARACLAISRGDYSTRVPTAPGPGGPDELSATAEAFNAMCARIEAQTQELEQHILRLQEVDRLKEDFFSMVTHDLKSPLATIKA